MLVAGVVNRNSARGRFRNSRRRDSANLKISENAAADFRRAPTLVMNSSMRFANTRCQSPPGRRQFVMNSASGLSDGSTAAALSTAATNSGRSPLPIAAEGGTYFISAARRVENTGFGKSTIKRQVASFREITEE